MNHTRQTSDDIKSFSPDAIFVVNCMGRKLFWDYNEDVEVSEISKNIQTTGFSALGELLRYNGTTFLNNLSIVCVAMREGSAVKNYNQDNSEYTYNNSNLPVTHRLAIFINTITEELMEKNKQLNDMLYKANHDALTGLLNRGAIERIIYDATEVNTPSYRNDWHLIMIDVDDFKAINDRYGHSKGDSALRMLADYLQKEMANKKDAEVGRWGGEEFMIYLAGYSNADVIKLAEKIVADVSDLTSESCKITVSIGVTNHHEYESVLGTIDRVDGLLYTAKNDGKNKVCSDL